MIDLDHSQCETTIDPGTGGYSDPTLLNAHQDLSIQRVEVDVGVRLGPEAKADNVQRGYEHQLQIRGLVDHVREDPRLTDAAFDDVPECVHPRTQSNRLAGSSRTLS
jgi:hypothetical protein